MRLGISSIVRDEYLTAIIKSVLSELKEIKDIEINFKSDAEKMFVVDYAVWRYQSKDGINNNQTATETGGMPRHIQLRLYSLFVRKSVLNENV